jgi:hypothetical protein
MTTHSYVGMASTTTYSIVGYCRETYSSFLIVSFACPRVSVASLFFFFRCWFLWTNNRATFDPSHACIFRGIVGMDMNYGSRQR